ncbi:NAD-dependent epimerase/dehydratase family protein [Cryobacterium melibiosiphilum]|uniref:NAD-dependent epimerase/dehydratase family protein n=2 Tax=Cryobacterium melibiosiphilum TaxID=995039 RepID=A0A3A5MPZ6_9MICO|nr:NAD-dependent epimerase/dehydratase family protein [Cryobacterium melibiosiphilum]
MEKSRTIALFGATGKTGRRVLARLLAARYSVRALARTPERLGVIDGLTVIAGDVLDPDAVAKTIRGSDAVISVFGQVKGSPLHVQTDGTRLIVEQMQAHGLTRIVSLSGGGLRDPRDRPKVADHVIRFLLKTLSGRVLADAEGHLRVLEQSGLDWTVVRGPRLTEKPGTGSYRLGWMGLDTGIEISRNDLADFILTQIDDVRFVRAMPFVSA